MSLRQTTSRCLALAGLSALAAFAAHVGTSQAPRVASSQSHASTAGATSNVFAGAAVRTSAALSSATTTAAALPIDQAGRDPLTVEPRVPRAAGAPCVVELVHDAPFLSLSYGRTFQYSPPAGCPPPWAKVILAVDLTGPRPIAAPNANVEITFFNPEAPPNGPGPIFVGAPQEHALVPLWRLERDLTEYASIFTRPQTAWLVTSDDNGTQYDPEFLSISAHSVKLLFYPPTAQTPAQRAADAVYAITIPNYQPAIPLSLPRNIERVYLDVYAQTTGSQRFWYSCVPQAAAAAYPSLLSKFAIGDLRDINFPRGGIAPDRGCTGGSYREIEVRIDGRLAGLAPLYPWLPSDIHDGVRDTVDYPAPSVQALNFMPYRVDLTPFAARLSNGETHTVQAVVVAAEAAGYPFVDGQLLVYLDHGRAQVTGALTRNTLAGYPAAPTVQDGLAQSGETLQGDIVTTSLRQYRIEGYVDTSHGRIRSSVWQRSRFANTQTFEVHDPVAEPYEHSYSQTIGMSSTVERLSRRKRGDTLLSEDRGFVSYPLALDYRAAGVPCEPQNCFAGLATLSVKVHQNRHILESHFRRGVPRYDTSLDDVFGASRTQDRTAPPYNSHWYSTRRYLFTDTLGSCYNAGLITLDGVLTSRTRGVACPDGKNHVRWFAHADGSPDGLGWAPQGP